MGPDDVFKFDAEKYAQSLHTKYPTIEALQANEKKKSQQIASATGSATVSTLATWVVGPVGAIGVGLSGRSLSVAIQKRDLIRKALQERYDVEKTSMPGKMFFKNAGRGALIKASTMGIAHGIEHFIPTVIPHGIDAAVQHGPGEAAAAIAHHPEHCLEGVKDGVASQFHALHTHMATGPGDAAAQEAAIQLGYEPFFDGSYLAGDAAAQEAAIRLGYEPFFDSSYLAGDAAAQEAAIQLGYEPFFDSSYLAGDTAAQEAAIQLGYEPPCG